MKGKNNKVIKVIKADSKRIFLTEINYKYLSEKNL